MKKLTSNDLIEELGMDVISEVLHSKNLEYIDDIIKKAKYHLNCLLTLRGVVEEKLTQEALKALIQINKEY